MSQTYHELNSQIQTNLVVWFIYRSLISAEIKTLRIFLSAVCYKKNCLRGQPSWVTRSRRQPGLSAHLTSGNLCSERMAPKSPLGNWSTTFKAALYF